MLALTWNAWNTYLGVICSAGFIGGFLIAVYRHFHKKFTTSVLNELKPVQQQLTTNGGSSLVDAVKRIETELNRQGSELDTVSLRMFEHLAYHQGREDALKERRRKKK
jgi:hypothetical protein